MVTATNTWRVPVVVQGRVLGTLSSTTEKSVRRDTVECDLSIPVLEEHELDMQLALTSARVSSLRKTTVSGLILFIFRIKRPHTIGTTTAMQELASKLSKWITDANLECAKIPKENLF
jgi:nitrogen fixation protein FixH